MLYSYLMIRIYCRNPAVGAGALRTSYFRQRAVGLLLASGSGCREPVLRSAAV